MASTSREIALHKKRFGQYFSGKAVADMLFSLLPKGRVWNSVVDPMVGIGDMLMTVSEHVSQKTTMLGVEIDEDVASRCKERLPEANIVCEDAFKCSKLLTPEGWELVITNPPYVRYQLMGEDESVMPSAHEIRKNLIRRIKAVKYLSLLEKNLFLALAKNYSGLADMAVPAWILSAMLVKKGGYLAIVVPETWLNREYAKPIQYLLNKCFTIEKIARDTDASWFPEALVKTCLVIAKRQEIRPINSILDQETLILELNKSHYQKTLSVFPHMFHGAEVNKWILDEDRDMRVVINRLPHELQNMIAVPTLPNLISLSDIGINCGQGLRTGANDFFYLSHIQDDGSYSIVQSKGWDHGSREYRISSRVLISTLQNRNEVAGLTVSADQLRTRVLYLQARANGEAKEYTISAEQYRDAKGRSFKEYSAVKPNEKMIDGQVVRFWYMLPKLVKRHMPNLCLTRVSSRAAECLYVIQTHNAPVAVDANMVTLWGDSDRNNLIAFAILNSTWSKLYLELICTVMGGGALKVEASHLKKMLFPALTAEAFSQLEAIGSRLRDRGSMTANIQNRIDEIVFSSFEDKRIIRRARKLLVEKLKERGVRS